jgi:hypothetical protein
VIYVDKKMLNGVKGKWRDWIVDEDGNRKKCGIINRK